MDIFENIKDKDLLLSQIKLITKKYKKGDIIFNENDKVMAWQVKLKLL